MKAKTPKLSTLKDKADTLTSLLVRQQHQDEHGMVKCVTCPKVLPWRESHCAHYIERGKMATRWMMENLKPACPGCNVFHKEYHKREYSLAMIDWHGREFVEELKALGRKVCSPSEVRNMAEEAIAYAKEQLKANGWVLK